MELDTLPAIFKSYRAEKLPFKLRDWAPQHELIKGSVGPEICLVKTKRHTLWSETWRKEGALKQSRSISSVFFSFKLS